MNLVHGRGDAGAMAPFGGAKSSGSGREPADGIADAVTETKQITFDF